MRLPQLLFAIVFTGAIPISTLAITTQDPKPLNENEIVINGEIEKITCEDNGAALEAKVLLERESIIDELFDLEKKNTQRFLDHPMNKEIKADYESNEAERKELLEKMTYYENLQRQLSLGTRGIKADITSIEEAIKNSSLLIKIPLYLQLAELKKELSDLYARIGDAHDAWKETQDEWIPVHNTSMQIEYDGKNAEKDLETIKVETRLSSSHAFEEKINNFCFEKQFGRKPLSTPTPIYEFPYTPDIKKSQRGNPAIRAEIDRLQKAHDATPEFRANPPKPCGIECMPGGTYKPRARLGNPLIRDALNPPKYYPCG